MQIQWCLRSNSRFSHFLFLFLLWVGFYSFSPVFGEKTTNLQLAMTSGKSTVRARNCNAYPQIGNDPTDRRSLPPVRSSGLNLDHVFTKRLENTVALALVAIWKTETTICSSSHSPRIKLGTRDTSSRFPGLYTIPRRRPPLGAPVRCTCCIRRPSSNRRRWLRTTHYT